MVSQAQGGRDGSLFLQTTLMGRVSTHPNQTPNQRRRKRSSFPAREASEGRFGQSLCRWDLLESFDGRLERFLLRWVVGV